MKKTIMTIVLVSSVNIFAANPADLTTFERVDHEFLLKVVTEKTNNETYVSMPFHDDYSFSIDAWQSKINDSKSYTGRLVHSLTPNLDAALVIKDTWNKSVSVVSARGTFDLHGTMFGIPSGLGFSIPFDQRDDTFKISPRMTFGDFTAFLTVGEEKCLIAGLSYSKNGWKFEVAYDRQEIWYIRACKEIKTQFGRFYPEIRTKFSPEEEYIGFGIGYRF